MSGARDVFAGRAPQASRGAAEARTPAAPSSGAGAERPGLPLGPWSFRAANTDADAAVRSTDPAVVGAALARQLGEAVATCVRNAPPSTDATIVDKLSSFVFTDEAEAFVAAVRRGEEPPALELPAQGLGEAFLGDPSKPKFFSMVTMNGRSSSGGMVHFRGDIFPEGFFRERTLSERAPVGCQKVQYVGARAPLLFEQPYFAREGEGYVFKLGDKQDNATRRLVDHLVADAQGPIELWRGTSPAFDTAAEVLAVQDDGKIGAGSMSAFGEDFGSLMTTPNRSTAEGWAREAVVRLSFSADELNDLVEQGLLYAGIEYDYIEMALLYARDPKDARGHNSIARMERVDG